jgi:hypothetical protein
VAHFRDIANCRCDACCVKKVRERIERLKNGREAEFQRILEIMYFPSHSPRVLRALREDG